MEVFCFDFDGVICDSAPETAVAAWNACRTLWPETPADLPQELQERFCRMRPVLHTGFEAVPLMRLIADGEAGDADILAGFAALRDAFMAREGLSRERLREVFGAARDRLVEADEARWLEWNRFFPGVGEVLQALLGAHPVHIITTKQERFVALLLRHHRIALPGERVFGLEREMTKPEVLRFLLGRPEWNGATFHFIEDRLDTLHDVLATPALEPVRLYLVDWGYNTPAQREEAAAIERIRVVSLSDLHGLWGT